MSKKDIKNILKDAGDMLLNRTTVKVEENPVTQPEPVVVKTEPKVAIDLFKGSDNIYYRVELKYDVDTMEATVVSVNKLDDTFPRAALKFEKEIYTKIRNEKYKKQEKK